MRIQLSAKIFYFPGTDRNKLQKLHNMTVTEEEHNTTIATDENQQKRTSTTKKEHIMTVTEEKQNTTIVTDENQHQTYLRRE